MGCGVGWGSCPDIPHPHPNGEGHCQKSPQWSVALWLLRAETLLYPRGGHDFQEFSHGLRSARPGAAKCKPECNYTVIIQQPRPHPQTGKVQRVVFKYLAGIWKKGRKPSVKHTAAFLSFFLSFNRLLKRLSKIPPK